MLNQGEDVQMAGLHRIHAHGDKLSDKLSQGPCINTLSKDCWDFYILLWRNQMKGPKTTTDYFLQVLSV